MGKALLSLTIANELHGGFTQPPQEVTAVLGRLDLPVIDRRDIAINLMKYGDHFAATQRASRRASRGTLDTVLNVANVAELAEYFGGRANLGPRSCLAWHPSSFAGGLGPCVPR